MQTSITSIPYLYVGLFSSSPDKFRDSLGSFSTFSFTELSSKWGFWKCNGFLSCPGGGRGFFKSNAEQKPQRHSFESQSRWTGEGFHFAEKDKAQLNRADPHNSRVITALCTFSDCSRPQQTQFRIHFKEQCVPRFQMCDT